MMSACACKIRKLEIEQLLRFCNNEPTFIVELLSFIVRRVVLIFQPVRKFIFLLIQCCAARSIMLPFIEVRHVGRIEA